MESYFNVDRMLVAYVGDGLCNINYVDDEIDVGDRSELLVTDVFITEFFISDRLSKVTNKMIFALWP